MITGIRSSMIEWFSRRAFRVSLWLALTLLQPCRADIPEEILKQLASGDFKDREKAEADLTEWSSTTDGEAAYDMLYRHAREHPEAEVRVRCLSVLRRLVSKIYDSEGQGYVGILPRDEAIRIPGQDEPVVVLQIVEVVPDSPAAKGGLLVGDCIVSLNNAGWKILPAAEDFRNQVKALKPKSIITLNVLRDGKLQDIKVSLARRPAAADRFLGIPEFERMNDAEEALREEHFKKWLLDRKNDR